MSVRQELEARFGDNFSDSLTERLSHSSDMGFVPQLVWAGIKINIVPDYVVYPTNLEDLVDLVRISRRYNLPLVPYGRATNRYGNAVPADGGIVVDFAKMDKVELNEGNREAIVQPGATWKIVDQKVQQKGMQLRTFPSSYDSTVGGGVASDSLGVGSYEYGFVCDNISYVKLASPKGDVLTLSGKDLSLVCGAEGTTGLIAEVGLKLRQFSPTEALTLSFDGLEQAIKAVGEFYREVIPAWHVQLRGPSISSYISKNFRAPLEADRWNMVVLYPSQRAPLVEPKVKRLAIATGARAFEGEWSGWWSFNHGVVAALRVNGLLIHQHGLIPYARLQDFINNMKRSLGKVGQLEGGFDLDVDLERREVLLVNAFVMSDLPPEDKKLLYELAKNTLMMEEMIKVGGSMLSVGIFVHQYARNRLSAMGKTFQEMGVDRYEAIRKFKEENDPDELMNPGKVFEPKNRAKAVSDIVRKQREALTFRFGIGIAKTLSRGGEVEGFTQVRKVMEAFADYGLKCIDCAMCVTVCPQYRLIPSTPYAPKGMFDLVKGAISMYSLTGSLEIPDSTIAEISGCHKCGLCDGVCPARIPISTLLVRLSSVVAKKRPRETPVSIPLVTGDLSNVIDKDSSTALWIGRAGIENTPTAIASLQALKRMGLKVNVVGTEGEAGFLDYIGGNGNEVIEAMRKNMNLLKGIEQVITISPEDYKMFSEVYSDYSKIAGISFAAEVTPIDLLILKSIDVRGEEEINLHIACFSSSYVDEIIKRLREKGFRVRRVEGCSGAQLEKSLGRRADKIAQAIAERYGKVVSLCPFAVAKFRLMGVEAESLTEYLMSKTGVRLQVEVFKLSKEESDQILIRTQELILQSLSSRAQVIADTTSFVSAGLTDYQKILEPVVEEALREAGANLAKAIRERSSKLSDPSKHIFAIREYIQSAVAAIDSISYEQLAGRVKDHVKKLSQEQFDEEVFAKALAAALREKISTMRDSIGGLVER